MISTSKRNKEYLKYPHQVAGHRFEDGKQGMLIDNDGTILKPIQGPPRGEREVDFYQNLNKEDADDVTLQLKTFIPKFYGVQVVPGICAPSNNKYIELEDVTGPFRRPCILDVKVGRVVFDHLAGEDKRKRGILKYPEQEIFGFRILGMKVYNKDLEEFKFFNKSYGKSLKTRQQIITGLIEFFQPRCNGIGNILKILEDCRAIHKWFLKQQKFRLYSSSILVVYEGDSVDVSTNDVSRKTTTASRSQNIQDVQEKNCKSSCDIDFENDMHTRMQSGDCAKKNENLLKLKVHEPSVHLIDFAHSYIGHFTEPDENYLYGLQNLIQCLEELIKL